MRRCPAASCGEGGGCDADRRRHTARPCVDGSIGRGHPPFPVSPGRVDPSVPSRRIRREAGLFPVTTGRQPGLSRIREILHGFPEGPPRHRPGRLCVRAIPTPLRSGEAVHRDPASVRGVAGILPDDAFSDDPRRGGRPTSCRPILRSWRIRSRETSRVGAELHPRARVRVLRPRTARGRAPGCRPSGAPAGRGPRSRRPPPPRPRPRRPRPRSRPCDGPRRAAGSRRGHRPPRC